MAATYLDLIRYRMRSGHRFDDSERLLDALMNRLHGDQLVEALVRNGFATADDAKNYCDSSRAAVPILDPEWAAAVAPKDQ